MGRGNAGLGSKATSCSAPLPRTSGCSLEAAVEVASGSWKPVPGSPAPPPAWVPATEWVSAGLLDKQVVRPWAQ